MQVDTQKLNDEVIPKLTNTSEYLDKTISAIEKLKHPTDLDDAYKKYLISLPQKLKDIESGVNKSIVEVVGLIDSMNRANANAMNMAYGLTQFSAPNLNNKKSSDYQKSNFSDKIGIYAPKYGKVLYGEEAEIYQKEISSLNSENIKENRVYAPEIGEWLYGEEANEYLSKGVGTKDGKTYMLKAIINKPIDGVHLPEGEWDLTEEEAYTYWANTTGFNERLAATLESLAVNFGQGVVKAGEDIIDAAVSIGGEVVKYSDAGKILQTYSILENATGAGEGKTFYSKIDEGVMDFVEPDRTGAWFDEIYWNTERGQWADEKSLEGFGKDGVISVIARRNWRGNDAWIHGNSFWRFSTCNRYCIWS